MTTSNKPPEQSGFKLSRRWLEPTGMVLMALGLVMMFQPFLLVLFTYSFIVILIGTLTFIVAVHLPN
jgi:hypothetical protein